MRFAQLNQMLRIDRWSSIALVVVCLGLGGCCSTNWRGEGFAEEPAQADVDQMRRPDPDVKFWGFSNKGRDIERHLGATE
jgi:hypothetical protein